LFFGRALTQIFPLSASQIASAFGKQLAVRIRNIGLGQAFGARSVLLAERIAPPALWCWGLGVCQQQELKQTP